MLYSSRWYGTERTDLRVSVDASALVLLVLLWLRLPEAALPSPLLGALRPISLGVGVIIDGEFTIFSFIPADAGYTPKQ